MKIVDRLPIREEGWSAPSPDGPEDVRSFQIVIQVSMAVGGLHEWTPGASTFPVVLDTGNNHNFAIRREHWDRWVHESPRRIGQINVGGFVVPLFDAGLWIHPNRPGSTELSAGAPHLLRFEQGIAIFERSRGN